MAIKDWFGSRRDNGEVGRRFETASAQYPAVAFGSGSAPIDPANLRRVPIRSIEDLRHQNLIDFRVLHPHWQGVIEGVYFAIAQRYPTGNLSQTKLLDVETINPSNPRALGSWAERRAADVPSYLMFNRTFLSRSVDQHTLMVLLAKNLGTRDHPLVDRPDIFQAVHEALHPPFEAARSIPAFRRELAEALSGVMGQRWHEFYGESELGTAVKEHISGYATVNHHEAVVEAAAEGVMLGNDARPAARAVLRVFDRWCRYDSPVVDLLVKNAELDWLEDLRGGPRTISRQLLMTNSRVPAEWQPQWKPLDISGRYMYEAQLSVFDHRKRFRQVSAEAPDAYFSSNPSVQEAGSTWSEGGVEKILTGVESPVPLAGLEEMPKSRVLGAPPLPPEFIRSAEERRSLGDAPQQVDTRRVTRTIDRSVVDDGGLGLL